MGLADSDLLMFNVKLAVFRLFHDKTKFYKQNVSSV